MSNKLKKLLNFKFELTYKTANSIEAYLQKP